MGIMDFLLFLVYVGKNEYFRGRSQLLLHLDLILNSLPVYFLHVEKIR
jgi:hypothetical protein